jgi:hypothetical protein
MFSVDGACGEERSQLLHWRLQNVVSSSSIFEKLKLYGSFSALRVQLLILKAYASSDELREAELRNDRRLKKNPSGARKGKPATFAIRANRSRPGVLDDLIRWAWRRSNAEMLISLESLGIRR